MLLNTQSSLEPHNRTSFVPDSQNLFVIHPHITREPQPPEPHPQEVRSYLLGQPPGCEAGLVCSAPFHPTPISTSISLLLFVLALGAIINILLVMCLYLKVFPSSIQEMSRPWLIYSKPWRGRWRTHIGLCGLWVTLTSLSFSMLKVAECITSVQHIYFYFLKLFNLCSILDLLTSD